MSNLTGKKKKQTHTSYCVSISAPRTAALSHLPPRCLFEIAGPKQSQKFGWVYIYISAWWKVLIWHTHPQNARGNKHTWGRSLISSRSKIITALTGLSGPHLTPLPQRFLICCDMWIRRCHVCIFRAEGSFLFCRHAEPQRERWWPAHYAPPKSPNKRSLAPEPGRMCNINHSISGSAGICIPRPRLMNESFLLISFPPNTLIPKAGLWGTSNRDRGVKGGEYRRNAVMNIWEASSGRNMLRERKSVFMMDLFKDALPCDWCKSAGVIWRNTTT